MTAFFRSLAALALLFTVAACNSAGSPDDQAETGSADSSTLRLERPAQPAPTAPSARVGASLIDLTTGRTLPLSQSGDPLISAEFSGDGRWLFFDTGLNAQNSSIHRIDLRDPNLIPNRIADGFMPLPNRDASHVAFIRRARSGADFELIVIRPDGSEKVLAPVAGPASWSPDGRWLAYVEGYKGEGQPQRAVSVFDAATGDIRVLGYVAPYATDYRVFPEWSSTSNYFTYLNSEAPGPGTRRVFQPRHDGALFDVHQDAWWASTGDSLYARAGETAVPVGPVMIHDARTGDRRPLSDGEQPDPEEFRLPSCPTSSSDGRWQVIDGACRGRV